MHRGRPDAIVSSPLIAAIDIGTNTLLTLVGRLGANGGLERVSDRASITRLGEGVDAHGELTDAGMERALRALTEDAEHACALGVTRFAAVATSAVRDARNRDEFLGRVRDVIGDDVAVISGEREAQLTFAGAGDATGVASGTRVLVFDVGGGSTEVIAGPLDGVASQLRSIDMGSVRLTERFLSNDPPSAAEVDRVSDFVAAALGAETIAPSHDVLLGLAATVTTLAAIDRNDPMLELAALHGSSLSRASVDRCLVRLAASSLAQRRSMVGLDPRRAGVIVAGAVIVRGVMQWAGAAQLVVSTGGVRVGLLLEQARSSSS